MVSGENVSIRADNHARAESLQRLFALPLWRLSTEKLPQRLIGEGKRAQSARYPLSRKHRYNTRRDLLDNWRERRDESLVRLLRFLCRAWKCVHVHE